MIKVVWHGSRGVLCRVYSWTHLEDKESSVWVVVLTSGMGGACRIVLTPPQQLLPALQQEPWFSLTQHPDLPAAFHPVNTQSCALSFWDSSPGTSQGPPAFLVSQGVGLYDSHADGGRTNTNKHLLSGQKEGALPSVPMVELLMLVKVRALVKIFPTQATLVWFLPVWILWCSFRVDCRPKQFPHSPHV